MYPSTCFLDTYEATDNATPNNATHNTLTADSWTFAEFSTFVQLYADGPAAFLCNEQSTSQDIAEINIMLADLLDGDVARIDHALVSQHC
jgi:hypothetical protein